MALVAGPPGEAESESRAETAPLREFLGDISDTAVAVTLPQADVNHRGQVL